MLEVTGLVAGYGERAIARLDQLAVANGHAAVLTGASGSGKTTALLGIAGLADQMAGEITIDGEPMSPLTARSRDQHRGRHIGMIFQDLHLVSGLSTTDNLFIAPYANGAVPDRRRAAALLERLGLSDRARADAATLSRGEAQRAALARALMLKPSLILADEPTASLDDAACAAVLELMLTAVREEDASLIVATHDKRVTALITDVVTVCRA